MRNLALFINNILLILFVFDLFLRATNSKRKHILPFQDNITKLDTTVTVSICYLLSISLILLNAFEAFILGGIILLIIKLFNIKSIYIKRLGFLLCIGGAIVSSLFLSISIFKYGIHSIKESILVIFNIFSSFIKIIIDLFVSFVVIFFFINIISNLKG